MTRKKKCCIILVAILILGIIITPIVLKIVNDNKNAWKFPYFYSCFSTIYTKSLYIFFIIKIIYYTLVKN